MRPAFRFLKSVLHPRTLFVGMLTYVAFFLNVQISRADWQPIFSQFGNSFSAAFFFNESVGFIAGQLEFGVFKTTDGGKTWVNTPIPKYPNGTEPTGEITQIRMTDQLHGWLTCEAYGRLLVGPPTLPGLYRTTDGGGSWNPINLNEQFSDVYQTSRARGT